MFNFDQDEKKPDDAFWPDEQPKEPEPEVVVVLPYDPPIMEESIRQSGLAWSAGIAFFGSVAFMMILGWLADLILGSSPWGIVGAIMIGSVIGFVQFFRITSQIHKKNKSPEIRSLMSHETERQSPPDPWD